MNKLWIIGDSHAEFYRNFSFCNAWQIESYLAYNLIEKPELEELIRNRVPKGSIIVFVFGEIDVRVHLKTHNNISECAERYVRFVMKFKNDYKLAIIGPIASTLHTKTEYSFLDTEGTCFERNQINSQLTAEIQKECHKHNILFKSFADKLIDKNGLTLMKYYDHTKIHLTDKAIEIVKPILEEIDFEYMH